MNNINNNWLQPLPKKIVFDRFEEERLMPQGKLSDVAIKSLIDNKEQQTLRDSVN
jgi:hypothetical protein